jgi:hypothetical protein
MFEQLKIQPETDNVHRNIWNMHWEHERQLPNIRYKVGDSKFRQLLDENREVPSAENGLKN